MMMMMMMMMVVVVVVEEEEEEEEEKPCVFLQFTCLVRVFSLAVASFPLLIPF